MTYRDICTALKNAGIDEYRYEAGLLISHFCDISPERLPFFYDSELASEQLNAALERRLLHYPLQYIIGTWSFCEEKYRIGEGCLIPRPETELLVLKAAELIPKNSVFLDMGTGSGCIAISLLCRRPDLSCVAVDISTAALEYAKDNARINGVGERIEFLLADMLSPSTKEKLNKGKYAALLSNPPYIPSKAVDKLAPELAFEPRNALDGGMDGLDYYRMLLTYSDCLSDDGFMLFETGYDQREALESLAAENGLDFFGEKDISGNFRNALIRRKL